LNAEQRHTHCTAIQDQIPDWLTGDLPATERAAFDAHLAQCPACRQELAAHRLIWNGLGAVPTPEPRPEIRTQFYAMLETAIREEAIQPRGSWFNTLLEQLTRRWASVPAAYLAYSLLLLGLGAAIGYRLQEQRSPDVAYRQQIDTLSAQMQEMRAMMMLTLLENPSATERLRAVSYTKDIGDVDGRVIDALLTTLNNDPNVNVRLVTLEALAELGHDPRVREGLIHALPQQDSPLVQVALADVMVRLQEKRSLKSLRKLMNQPDVNDLVKSKIEQSIRDLS